MLCTGLLLASQAGRHPERDPSLFLPGAKGDVVSKRPRGLSWYDDTPKQPLVLLKLK